MIEWVTANWELCLGAVGALLALFVSIAKLTPTKTDDAIADKAKQVFDSVTKKG